MSNMYGSHEILGVLPVGYALDVDVVLDDRKRRAPGVAAVYPMYFGDQFLRFDHGKPDIDPRCDIETVSSRSEWRHWSIVDSPHAGVYAEPRTTTRLEAGAVAYPADRFIDGQRRRLGLLLGSAERDEVALAHCLRMLGHVSAGEDDERRLLAGALRGVSIQRSYVEICPDAGQLVVCTPYRRAKVRDYTDEKQRQLAKAGNELMRVRFDKDGSYRGVGKSLRFGRARVVPAMVKLLRRVDMQLA